MRFLSYVLVAVLSAALSVWMFIQGYLNWMFDGVKIIGPARSLNPPKLELAYSDFVSILLTALGLILAALAIGIGIIAFRTIGEIKREAKRIAEDQAKRSLKEQVKEHLPAEIDEAVEKLLKDGRLDEALQKAMLMFTAGGGEMNMELQPGFENQNDEEDNNA